MIPSDAPVVLLFGDDLRLADNPALHAAVATGRPVVPLFVLSEDDGRALGAAQLWWLHGSLASLAGSLGRIGSGLVLRRGSTAMQTADVVFSVGACAVHVSRRYGREGAEALDALAEMLGDVPVHAFEGRILHRPEEIRTGTGNFYRVYTPFRKNVCARGLGADPLPAPERLRIPDGGLPPGDPLEDWNLRPSAPDWADGLRGTWKPGEENALALSRIFVVRRLCGYGAGRDVPGNAATSLVSPHLRFGEISPGSLLRLAEDHAAAHGVPEEDVETFRRELLWRDFNYHLLHHLGDLAERNIARRFDGLPWRDAGDDLEAWRRGRTGYPIVDAGMRQLWRTGWMHNRVRMIVGSFLTRHLLIDWREGERWFWDTLVDADPASNPAQWQWIAGTGADAQPFFRIFAPVTQSRKFDPDGVYVRRWVPELARLPDHAVHAPWEADAEVLARAGVRLGRDYPEPIVDHASARRRALDAYAELRATLAEEAEAA